MFSFPKIWLAPVHDGGGMHILLSFGSVISPVGHGSHLLPSSESFSVQVHDLIMVLHDLLSADGSWFDGQVEHE